MSRVRIHHRWIGYESEGSGLPVICIPPPVIGAKAYHYQLEDLSRDYRVIVLHPPGHGESSAYEGKMTYSSLSDDIRDLMDALDIPQAVVSGYSTGGAIALECMRAHPERFIAGVPVGAFSEVSDPILRGFFKLVTKLAETNCRQTLARGISLFNGKTKAMRQEMYRAGCRANLPDVAAIFGAALSFHITSSLDQIRQPVLLVYGKRDMVLRRYAHILSQRIPNSEVVWIPGVAHQVPPKAAPKFNACVREFLGHLPSR